MGGGGLFGGAPTPAPVSTGGGGFSFGAAATQPAAATAAATAAPSTSTFSFGTPAAAAPTTSTGTGGGGGLFGAAPTATPATPAATGFSFGAAQPAAAAPAAAGGLFGAAIASKPAATTGGSLFGAAPAATPTAATPAAPSLFGVNAAAPTPAPAGAGLFGGGSTGAAAATGTTTFAPKMGSSLFGGTAGATTATATGTTAAAPAQQTTTTTTTTTKINQTGPPPVNLNKPTELVGKSVTEILQYWNKELAQRTIDFKKKAQIIADWDEQIIERRRELFEMQVDLVNAKSQQDVMERQIRVIEQHQEDTEFALTEMENGVDRLYQQLGETLDVDRDVSSTARLYGLAEQVSGQILQIGNSLRDASKTIARYQTMQEQRGLRKGEGDATRSLVSALNNQLAALKHIDRQLDYATNRIDKDRLI